MAEKKNQHYVPQSYLRNFSADKKNLWILNLKTHNSYYGPIKTQASLPYFYSKNIEVEDYLSNVEKDGIKVINMLLDDSYRKLNEFEFASLCKYMILQLARTKNMADKMAYFLNDKLRHMFMEQSYIEHLDNHLLFKFEYPSLLGLHYYLNHMVSFFDLEMKVIEIDTTMVEHFVTSDNPVYIFNPYYQQIFGRCLSINLYQAGLIVYFPISPFKAICLYDKEMYQVGETNSDVVNLCLKQDIISLNFMIAFSAKNSVFYKNESDVNIINNDVKVNTIRFLKFKSNSFQKKIIRYFPIYLYLNPEMRYKIEKVLFKEDIINSLSIKL